VSTVAASAMKAYWLQCGPIGVVHFRTSVTLTLTRTLILTNPNLNSNPTLTLTLTLCRVTRVRKWTSPWADRCTLTRCRWYSGYHACAQCRCAKL